jgi:hypothetical protein
MKKYTHPYYSISLVVSSNGATNYLISFSNSKFSSSSFDCRIFLEKTTTEEVGTDESSMIFINEYLHNSEILWFSDIKSFD